MNLALPAVASPEAFNTPGGIYHPLLSGEERMTLITQLYLYLLFSRANGKGVTTGADRLCVLVVCRMNLVFHLISRSLRNS
jgi:hypothetical protein